MTDLARLVAMRLTHDLAGPIGAIATAVELLDGGDPEIRELISDGAAAAVASLRLHRFILAPPEDAGPARRLLAAWIATRDGLLLDWQAGVLDSATAAIVLGLAMCAGEAAPKGGLLDVSDGGVTLTAATVRLDPDVAAALDGAPVAIPRAALAGLLHAAAAAAGLAITVARGDDRLCLGYQGIVLPR